MKYLLIALFSFYSLYAQDKDRSDYFKLGEKLKDEQKYDEALIMFEKFIESKKEIEDDSLAFALNETGYVYQELGNYEEAKTLYEKALILSKQLNIDSTIVIIHINLGVLYSSLGDDDNALLLYKEALPIAEKNNMDSDKAILLSNIGTIFISSGEYYKAKENFEKALEINKKLNDTDGILTRLNNLGVVSSYLGQYDKSIMYFEESFKLRNELKIEKDIDILLNNMGNIYFLWGQYDKALNYFQKALDINRKIGQEQRIAIRLNNIGKVYQAEKHYSEALKNYEEALSISKKLGEKERISTRLNNIGTIFRTWGDYKMSIKYFEEALAFDKAQGKEPDISVDLNNIGLSYMLLGDLEKSRTFLQDAISLGKKLNHKSNTAAFQKNYGDLSYLENNYSVAIERFEDAIKLLEEIRQTATGDAKRDYLATQIETYNNLMYSYIKNRLPYKAIESLENSSARYLNEQISNTEIDSIRLNISNFQDKIPLNTSFLFFSNVDSKNNLAKFILRKDTIIVKEMNTANFISEIDSNTLKIALGYLKKENPFIKDKLELSHLAAFYISLLSKSNPGISEMKLQKEIGGLLYNFLIRDIEKDIQDFEQLVIIPGGSLALIPFETLIMPDGKYLVEKYNIKYVQSLAVSELLTNRQYNDNRKPILAFGGAVYDSLYYDIAMIQSEQHLRNVRSTILNSIEKGEKLQESYASLGYSNISNLPATHTEVKALENIFMNGNVIAGKDVNESVVKKMSNEGELKNYKIIHFATHGITVPEIPELSALVLSQTKNNKDEDGFLLMQEIADLELNADFVNLSACETGLGKIYNGEGVVGLTQAFLIAGANGVSVSLWSVEDESTMQFMTGMYRLAKEKDLLFYKALTEMKREFIRTGKYSLPFYWAPFVYWGK